MKNKVYSVTLQVKVVVRAPSRQAALLDALSVNKIGERLESIKPLEIFCPAEGK